MLDGLELKVTCLNKLICYYTNLIEDSNCHHGIKKIYEQIITLLVGQKVKFQEIISDIKLKKEFEIEMRKLLKDITK